MTSILFNLSGKIEKTIVDALYLLKRIANSLGIPFFVIGAFSRDLILKHGYGIEPRRKTGDIDLGVEVANWEQFETLKKSLIATGQFSLTSDKQRLRCGTILI
jgi:predicted nucleotidyltransferase